MTVTPGRDDSTARRTDGDVHVRLIEQHAFRGKCVQIRRQIGWLATVDTKGLSVQIIGRKQQDVGTVGGD